METKDILLFSIVHIALWNPTWSQ